MCGGKVGKVASALNPVKAIRRNPIENFKNVYRASEGMSAGQGIAKSLDMDVMAKAVNGRRDAKLKAQRDAAFAERQAVEQSTATRAAEAASYNADVIASKRRRKAGSLLARGGVGVESSNSALATAATYGKNTLGA